MPLCIDFNPKNQNKNYESWFDAKTNDLLLV